MDAASVDATASPGLEAESTNDASTSADSARDVDGAPTADAARPGDGGEARALGGPLPSLEVVAVEATGVNPKGAFLSHDERTLYVTNFRESGRHSVSVFDADSLAPAPEIVIPGSAVEATLSLDDKTLYVSNFWRHSVMFIDTATRAVVAEVKTGAHPKIVVLSADGKSLFVANWSGDSVTQIDVASASVVRTLQAGKRPRGMVVTKRGTLYVANFFGDSIDVFEGEALSRHHRIKACKCPRHLALSPDDATLYVSCLTASQVQSMDLATETVTRRAQVGDAPKSIGISEDGRYVYSADYGLTRSVSIVDTRDMTSRVFHVPGMDRGSGVAVTRDGKHAFVTGWYDNHVYKVGWKGLGGDPTIASKKIEKWRYRAFSADPGDGP